MSNGLNQYTNIDGFTQSYDLNDNLSISRQSDGNGGTASTTYTYDPENRLVAASGEKTATLRYDPFGRLYEVTDAQGGTTRFHYDGDALIGEYNAGGTLLQRYVHGPSAGDDPLIRYAGSSTERADARFLYSDRLGSIIQEVANNGTQTALNSYDPYGVPGATSGINNIGRFRYTGQVWLEELGMYYYKARMYSPTLGRFMQTDPIDYEDGMNLYRYVHNDPANFIDPTGTMTCEGFHCDEPAIGESDWERQARSPYNDPLAWDNGWFVGSPGGFAKDGEFRNGIIVVTAKRLKLPKTRRATQCGSYTPGGAAGGGIYCGQKTQADFCKAHTQSDALLGELAFTLGFGSTVLAASKKSLPVYGQINAGVWSLRAIHRAGIKIHCERG